MASYDIAALTAANTMSGFNYKLPDGTIIPTGGPNAAYAATVTLTPPSNASSNWGQSGIPLIDQAAVSLVKQQPSLQVGGYQKAYTDVRMPDGSIVPAGTLAPKGSFDGGVAANSQYQGSVFGGDFSQGGGSVDPNSLIQNGPGGSPPDTLLSPAQGGNPNAQPGNNWTNGDPYAAQDNARAQAASGTMPSGLSSGQQKMYDQLVKSGAPASVALNAVQQMPNQGGTSGTGGGTGTSDTGTGGGGTSTQTGTGIAYDSSWTKYGITNDLWNQMSPTQQGVVGAAMGAASALYSSTGNKTDLNAALARAATDPTIVAKYADALAMDTTAFQQNLQQIQTATTNTAQQQQMQFENERKALATQMAGAGEAYSGFRGLAQQQLGQSEQGIVTSSLSQLQKSLNDATSAFTSKYGSQASLAATANYLNPLNSAQISLSGQDTGGSATSDTVSGAQIGGITGTQPIQKQQDINTLAGQYVTLGQIPNVIPA